MLPTRGCEGRRGRLQRAFGWRRESRRSQCRFVLLQIIAVITWLPIIAIVGPADNLRVGASGRRSFLVVAKGIDRGTEQLRRRKLGCIGVGAKQQILQKKGFLSLDLN